MSQHDYVIENGSGLAVRQDINSVLAAIVSGNSGATEPITTYANMPWFDTTNNQYKIRDKTNSFWIVIATATATGVTLQGEGLSLTGNATISGTLGLGVTPSAWATSYSQKAFQFSDKSALSADTNTVSLSQNAVKLAGGWTYLANAYASRYDMNNSTGTHAWYIAPSGTVGAAIPFTQAMTLDANGNLLVGTSVPGNTNALALAASTGTLHATHINGTASGAAFSLFYYNGVNIGAITQNGTTSVAYNMTSDHRLKENVRPADAKRFMDIEFVDFEWVDGRHDCGVIADQLQGIYPDLVIGEKDATEIRTVEIKPAVKDEEGNEITPAVTEEQEFPVYQQVNYTGLIGRMGTIVQKQQRMLQEAMERIEALEAKLK